MPFGRPWHRRSCTDTPGRAEAVARIDWCISQYAFGVITGEGGVAKTVAIRAATAALDASRHVTIYLRNPSVGVRGMLHHIVATLGHVTSCYTAALAPQAAEALAALDQRIAVRYAIAGMRPTETGDYITHHLGLAGRTDTLFRADAITLIDNASHGYPRAVNSLAVNALTAAFAKNSTIVDEKAARVAITETGAD
ncbi:AAA family ATPase [Leekyejoonella antrihumi]|uniref:AAA family ATPase n=1 Tax=Leekyejoonella antrihumi TaxID=1660198 RepID=UPI0016449B29|nr:AAA family ATPase [Leekyejoonella antrihumi]